MKMAAQVLAGCHDRDDAFLASTPSQRQLNQVNLCGAQINFVLLG